MCCIFPSSKLQCLRSIPVELLLKDSSFLTLTVMWSQYGKRRIMCSDMLIWWFEEAFVSLVTWRNLHNPQTWHACFRCSVLHLTIWPGWTSQQQLNWVSRINRANSNSSYVMNVKWHQMLEKSQVSWRSFPHEMMSMFSCPCTQAPNEEYDLMHLSYYHQLFPPKVISSVLHNPFR